MSQHDDTLGQSIRQQLEEFLESNEGEDLLRSIVEWLLQELIELEFDEQLGVERCPARPGKRRPSFRLSFLPSKVAVTKRRRKMRLSKQDGKFHRAAIEGTIREVKHPFPAGKLPVRGLFRMTCLLVGSATMTNVRRIHHYWEEKRKDERHKMAAETGAGVAPEQQSISSSSFLRAFSIGQRFFMALSKAGFDC